MDDHKSARLTGRLLSILTNMFLRGFGLIARFGLVVYLTQGFGLDVVGVFGLITAAIAIAPSFLSLGLHYRLNRAAVDFSQTEIAHRIRDRLLLYVVIFVSFLPVIVYLILSLAPIQIRNLETGIVFILIVFFEACAVELGLILTSTRRVMLANIFLFVRSAAWILPFVGFSYFFPSFKGLHTLLCFWLSGLIFSFFFVGISLSNLPWRSAFAKKLDFQWFFVHSSTSLMILVSDIGLVGGQFIDRAVLGFYLKVEDIGVYTFFWSIANGVQVLVQSAVVQPAFPNLVQAAKHKTFQDFTLELRNVLKTTLVVATPLSIVIFGLCVLALPSLDNSLLNNNIAILGVLLVGVLVRLLADVLNYALYALNLDSELAWINFFSLLLLATYSSLLASWIGLAGVGFAIVLTALSLFLLRFHFVKSSIK